MIRYINTVQKRIGLLISLVGFIVWFDNIINRFLDSDGDFAYIITGISVWLLFITLLPFVVSIFRESKFLKMLQVFLILFTGIINIYDAYDTIYGPGLFLAAWLLARHYGYFEFHKVPKYIASIVFLVLNSQFSAFIHGTSTTEAGIAILEYTTFIVIFIIIIWRDMVIEREQLKKENIFLKVNYNHLRDEIAAIENEKKPYNLKAVRISPAEERVIKTLVVYKASNREIAERLNIAESTVKLHLYNIYNKIGVDNRFAIIDLCKYNYG